MQFPCFRQWKHLNFKAQAENPVNIMLIRLSTPQEKLGPR